MGLAPGALSAGGDGPDVELQCPCTFQTGSTTSALLKFGVTNIGTKATGALTLSVWAHTARTYNEANGDVKNILEFPFSDSLAAKTSLAPATYKYPVKTIDAGNYYVTFLLLKDGSIIDQWRMNEKVKFGNVAGRSSSSLYFDTDPTATVSGGKVTVDLPVVVNAGKSARQIKVQLVATESIEYFGVSNFLIGEYEFNGSLVAGAKTGAARPVYTIPNLPIGFDFYHLAVVDKSSNLTLVMQTVKAPNTTYFKPDYDVESLDFLTDSDGDGVADDNESFVGTNSTSAASVPGKSTIDVLVVYSTGVKTAYNGDPSARIDHLISVSNQALADSKVEMTLRLAAAVELDMDESQSIDEWLNAAENGQGPFAGLAQLREDKRADIVVMFRPYDKRNTCGLAGLGGAATQGLLDRTIYINANFIEFDACQDYTMMHEMGHNMGLAHSYQQNVTGTFNWSRGYGVQNSFTTIMGYGNVFNTKELPYFSSPDIKLCKGGVCGVDINEVAPAHSAKSLNIVRFQVAQYSAGTDDQDKDGVADVNDAFPSDGSESVDTDGDGLGDNEDNDDDNDGMPDNYELAHGFDPLVDDASVDSNNNGKTNLEEYLALPKATQFLQTTSASTNVTTIHIVNTSSAAQSFTGNLFAGSGARLGAADSSLSASKVPPRGRLVLTSVDLEKRFGADPWGGPAVLEVMGSGSFELMSKLSSPSQLVSNTNCVRQDRVLNIEGQNSDNNTFVRFINTTDSAMGIIRGTLYNAEGNVIGAANTRLLKSLAPKSSVWINRGNIESLFGAKWDNEALLEVGTVKGLKLLNLNFVNNETFFNFSCFENATSGRIFLQTTSNSANSSMTHIVNTSNVAQQFTGTLYNGDGKQLGGTNLPLHTGVVAPRGRVIVSSADLENRFSASPWQGPAVIEVKGTGEFELMTKLASPSKLVSNTNCVRQNEVHNVESNDAKDVTYVRFINTGSAQITNLKGSLYDTNGDLIGAASQTLLASLAPKASTWLNRNQLTTIFGQSWVGEATLTVDGPADLRLLNLTFVNSETFFNFSCYEASK